MFLFLFHFKERLATNCKQNSKVMEERIFTIISEKINKDKSLPQKTSPDLKKLCKSIEQEFRKEVNAQAWTSFILNLKDPNNHTLIRGILTEKITPTELPRMKSRDMMDVRQKIAAEADLNRNLRMLKEDINETNRNRIKHIIRNNERLGFVDKFGGLDVDDQLRHQLADNSLSTNSSTSDKQNLRDDQEETFKNYDALRFYMNSFIKEFKLSKNDSFLSESPQF